MRFTKEYILATGNEGKLREFNHAFEELEIRFVSSKYVPGAPEVEETGETYEENAMLKARAIAMYTGRVAVADDSGIEIDAMPGELGVKSARFGGGLPPVKVNEIILARLEKEKNRACRYICAIAVFDPVISSGRIVTGVCEGVVHDKQEGDGGFGFDPIFYMPEYSQTMAQLPLDIKNMISHRAKAIEKLKELLK